MTERTFHIIGPPGTGKTSYLSRQAENAVQTRGSRSVAIMSLTKAASREIAGRNTTVAEENIGTLHAHCYRALGQPTVAESQIPEWNKECAPIDRLSPMKKNVFSDDGEINGQATDGDAAMAQINILRSNMVPPENWSDPAASQLYSRWVEWKKNNDLMDFTDMIETCIRDVDQHPSKPSVMLGDEAQDWSTLEAVLFREKWGKHADTVILAGDEDQSLYTWRGSDPHIFSGHPIPVENTKVLEQSYRVPRSIHRQAQGWIRRITDRKDVTYKPRGEDGVVNINHEIKYKYPEDILANIKSGETSMILCSCAYMVNSVCKSLRNAGVPFHNPYRTANGGWNPLLSRRGAVTSSDRLYAFLFPDNDNHDMSNVDRWSKESMARWVPLLGGVFKSGTKEMVKAGHFKLPRGLSDWRLFFKNESDMERCLKLDIDWFRENVISSKRQVMDFPLQIAAKRGRETLNEKPSIVVGTIHSVKGGEADNVFVFPDISYRAMKQEGNMDSIIRMFYVAMTRAKKSLTLCGPSTRYAVEW